MAKRRGRNASAFRLPIKFQTVKMKKTTPFVILRNAVTKNDKGQGNYDFLTVWVFIGSPWAASLIA